MELLFMAMTVLMSYITNVHVVLVSIVAAEGTA